MITTLPASIGDLTSLLHLDLGANQLDIESIPKSLFGHEMLLERLYLSDNNLTELSDDFTELVNLKILALKYSKL